MLDSVPLPFQAILWPLVGGGVNLVLNRLLPGWVRRLVATAAALASLGALWSLKTGGVERAQILWEPVNFFRMSPTLAPDGLSLLIGIALAAAAAAMALGIRGQEPQHTAWHGLFLLLLAGCLAVTMAANALTLAAGSALVDLALILLVLRSSSRAWLDGRLSLSLVVPGVASTLLIFFGALQMDAQLGHGSLLSQNLPKDTLVVIGVAGALRALVFPLHARGLRLPETAAALLLSIGAGGYLLARVQASPAPALAGRPWVMAVAVIGVLAGGLLAWSSATRSGAPPAEGSSPGRWWTGVLAYQSGYLLAFVLLLAGGTPWPVVSMVLALAVLAIWWDDTLDAPVPSSRTLDLLRARFRPWLDRVESGAVGRFRSGGWQRSSRLRQRAAILLPATALASLVGMPLTLGARGRWPYYAAWLKRGDPSLMLILVAEVLLVAGLGAAFVAIWEQSRHHRPRPAALAATIALTVLTVLLGLAPGILSGDLDLTVERADVSAWGLGLLYLLPWLVGAWLGRFRGLQPGPLDRIWNAVNFDWFYRGAAWVGQRLVDIVHWLGEVGEGEGWWGWALIILALGVVLFTVQ